MPTSSFGRNFYVAEEKAEEFIEEVTKKIVNDNQISYSRKEFVSKAISRKELREMLEEEEKS